MICHYLLHSSPLIQCILANYLDAFGAKVFNLSLVRAARVAVILKVDVDDEVGRNYFVFIFAYIFGTELHLASLDIVASLDKRRIEHDPAHGLVRKASMLEHYFNIALQNQIPLLLLC